MNISEKKTEKIWPRMRQKYFARAIVVLLLASAMPVMSAHYVIPHPGWVVCGGTDAQGALDDRPDPAVHDAIVARCREAVPELRDAEVLGSRVGFRPVATQVSLERRSVHGRTVVTNAGHGGAGVTLAWGCADEVLGLVEREG